MAQHLVSRHLAPSRPVVARERCHPFQNLPPVRVIAECLHDDRKTFLSNAHFNFKLFVVHLRDTTTPGMSPDPRGHMRTHLVLTAVIIGTLSSAADTSPFYVPIRNNDLATLRKLIRNPGPKTADARGNSPLMYSAALGSVESMRLLLDA